MSSKQKMTIEVLFSEQTIEKLDKALTKLNMEQLKKQMEKLFTFKNIYNMHEDHLIELAETVIDIAQAQDRIGYIQGIEKYVRSRMQRYSERKAAIIKENQWAKAVKLADEVEKLDLTYRLWEYEHGYKFSEYHMYSMLCGIIRATVEHEQKAGAEK